MISVEIAYFVLWSLVREDLKPTTCVVVFYNHANQCCQLCHNMEIELSKVFIGFCLVKANLGFSLHIGNWKRKI